MAFPQAFLGLLLLSCGQVNMNNSQPAINKVDYFKIFNPPETQLNYRGVGLDGSMIDQKVVRLAIEDGKRSGEDLVLFKVVEDKKLHLFHYIFSIQHHDDLFSVYSIRVDNHAFEYRFYFSPN